MAQTIMAKSIVSTLSIMRDTGSCYLADGIINRTFTSGRVKINGKKIKDPNKRYKYEDIKEVYIGKNLWYKKIGRNSLESHRIKGGSK